MANKELDMCNAQGKHVKITCTDGQIIKGFCELYTQPLDNEPEVAELSIRRGTASESGLISVTEPEIDKIEYVN